MHDDTESIRRLMLEAGVPATMAAKAETLTTAEMSELYTVLAFMAPYVVVRRKHDGAAGTLMFTHSPRRYFNWQADNQEDDR